jgi:hypothetical protein
MSVTAAALQAQLSTDAAGPQVLAELSPYGTASQYWLVQGGAKYPGVTKLITTTAANTAAQQASTINTKMLNPQGND